ncbi:hypothetical protein ONZ45_g11692 [Pleurotus djamor]|nr:hypothetical protein ONZ45_g11692 [Pleurotus djamor]
MPSFFSFAFVFIPLFSAFIAASPLVNLSIKDIKIKAAAGNRLLRFAPNAEPVWKTEKEKFELMRSGVHFFDITHTYERERALLSLKARQLHTPPLFLPSNYVAITKLLSKISIPNMRADLTKLTSFNNRFYNSTTGAEASQWIYNTVANITSERDDITVSSFEHPWLQTTTIVRFAGKSTSAPVTILGAHMDSINFEVVDVVNAPAQGADDDGSGTVNLIEALRLLVGSGFTPSEPLEFHWYAAEEVGLEGSYDVATKYAEDKVPVKAFLQVDMSAYFKPGEREVIGLVEDYVNSDLINRIEVLVQKYTRLPVARFECGYGCSDHASWDAIGAPAALIAEPMGEHNPTIHTANDTMDAEGFSWEHSVEFAKLLTAFAYEYSV